MPCGVITEPIHHLNLRSIIKDAAFEERGGEMHAWAARWYSEWFIGNDALAWMADREQWEQASLQLGVAPDEVQLRAAIRAHHVHLQAISNGSQPMKRMLWRSAAHGAASSERAPLLVLRPGRMAIAARSFLRGRTSYVDMESQPASTERVRPATCACGFLSGWTAPPCIASSTRLGDRQLRHRWQTTLGGSACLLARAPCPACVDNWVAGFECAQVEGTEPSR